MYYIQLDPFAWDFEPLTYMELKKIPVVEKKKKKKKKSKERKCLLLTVKATIVGK